MCSSSRPQLSRCRYKEKTNAKMSSKRKVAVKVGWVDENSLSVDMHMMVAYKDRDKNAKIL